MDKREPVAVERGDDRVGVVAQRVWEARGGLFWTPCGIRSAVGQGRGEAGSEHGGEDKEAHTGQHSPGVVTEENSAASLASSFAEPSKSPKW